MRHETTYMRYVPTSYNSIVNGRHNTEASPSINKDVSLSVFGNPLSNSSGNKCVILKGVQYRTVVLNFYFSKEEIGS